LPFRGEWLVFWGGSTLETNRHVTTPSGRRAADLDKVDANDRDHTGDGKRNEDYFSYGAEVLAVADGTVVQAIDGVEENVPGTLNPSHVGGNEIVIAHEGGEHSRYAHLQPGKHRVRRGDPVKRGDVIGIAGNSGNSSQPHLHFQLEDGSDPLRSWGIEPVFNDLQVTRDGRSFRATGYTFSKGDRIASP
jgi:murein DD-endopeptidase MepM/ murein hydrolase activator NlpD